MDVSEILPASAVEATGRPTSYPVTRSVPVTVRPKALVSEFNGTGKWRVQLVDAEHGVYMIKGTAAGRSYAPHVLIRQSTGSGSVKKMKLSPVYLTWDYIRERKCHGEKIKFFPRSLVISWKIVLLSHFSRVEPSPFC
jgi:hypothetical protein